MNSIAPELQNRIDRSVKQGSPSPIEIIAYLLLAVLAGGVFFIRLGATPLNDWDEAWHAQVSKEILSTGDWATLHCRGEFYFNKPPLTFWLRAIAYRVGGVNETAARFFPALFAWGSVLAVAGFFGRLFGRWVGITAGFVLASSWLFTFYHAGRSGEADSALIFFSLLTVMALWRARFEPRSFYVAGACTALAWMTKGATAYLPWIACLLAAALERPKTKWRWRHAASGLALAVALTLPWQALMLVRHGRAFAHAFYMSEGALPALNAVEDHPGSPFFYVMILHQYFEPWLLLAAAAVLTKLLTRRSLHSGTTLWLVTWSGVVLVGCSLFATKMVWYVAPCLPAIAGLSAVAVVDLSRRRWGSIVMAGIAVFGVWQARVQHWSLLDGTLAIVLMLGAVLTCTLAPLAKRAWHFWIAGLLAAIPIAQHFSLMYRVVVNDEEVTGEIELRNTDEPWRELTAHLSSVRGHEELVLVDFPLEPASYFYLNRMVPPPKVKLVEHTTIESGGAGWGGALVVARVELADLLRAAGFTEIERYDSLAVFRKDPSVLAH